MHMIHKKYYFNNGLYNRSTNQLVKSATVQIDSVTYTAHEIIDFLLGTPVDINFHPGPYRTMNNTPAFVFKTDLIKEEILGVIYAGDKPQAVLWSKHGTNSNPLLNLIEEVIPPHKKDYDEMLGITKYAEGYRVKLNNKSYGTFKTLRHAVVARDNALDHNDILKQDRNK